MEWITWFEFRKYYIASIYVEKPKRNLHNPSEQSVVIDMLHQFNDYPPMKLTFRCHRVAGKIYISSVTNSLGGVSSDIKVPTGLAKELEREKSETVKNLLMMLTWS